MSKPTTKTPSPVSDATKLRWPVVLLCLAVLAGGAVAVVHDLAKRSAPHGFIYNEF